MKNVHTSLVSNEIVKIVKSIKIMHNMRINEGIPIVIIIIIIVVVIAVLVIHVAIIMYTLYV